MHFISSISLAFSCLVLTAVGIPLTDSSGSLVLRDPRPTPEQQTDGLLFHTPMDSFLAAKRARNPPNLNWEGNGCNIVPDDPIGFDFHNSCVRHDFGYGNYKIQGRCSENERSRIDENFKKDMEDECDKQHGSFLDVLDRSACKIAAGTYYKFVRGFGEPFFC